MPSRSLNILRCGVGDNAANMTRCVRLLNEEEENEDVTEEGEDEMSDHEDHERAVDSEMWIMIIEGEEIRHMSCAAHTFQLDIVLNSRFL